MHRTKALLTKAATLGLGLLMLGSATTWAGDMCIQDQNGGGITVAKNFAFPAPNACRAVDAYMANSPGCVVSGTACRTADAIPKVVFNVSYGCPWVEQAGPMVFDIDPNPNFLNGNGFFCQSGSGQCAPLTMKVIPCPTGLYFHM